MLDEAALKQIIHAPGLSQTVRLLLCLAVGDQPKSISEVTNLAVNAGVSAAKKWNASQLLSASKGKAIKTPAGWELSQSGKNAIEPLIGPLSGAPAPKAATSLRSQLAALANPDTRGFVEEAIACFEYKLYRAAVVLSWVGALSVLYDHIVSKRLADFNAEATRRDSKWRAAKNADGLARMQEYDFLQILEAISVIGKSVKNELEGCLKLRNGCGHPNSLKVAEHRVSSHIEVLLLNVFGKF